MVLTSTDRTALTKIYDFSKTRGFRYGLNEDYVPGGKSTTDHLFSHSPRMIYYKTQHRRTYWFPTKAGRKAVETNFGKTILRDFEVVPGTGFMRSQEAAMEREVEDREERRRELQTENA